MSCLIQVVCWDGSEITSADLPGLRFFGNHSKLYEHFDYAMEHAIFRSTSSQFASAASVEHNITDSHAHAPNLHGVCKEYIREHIHYDW